MEVRPSLAGILVVNADTDMALCYFVLKLGFATRHVECERELDAKSVRHAGHDKHSLTRLNSDAREAQSHRCKKEQNNEVPGELSKVPQSWLCAIALNAVGGRR